MENKLKEKFESIRRIGTITEMLEHAYQMGKEDSGLWVLTSKQEPIFNEYVWCYCSIYGRYIGKFINIGELEGKLYGNWHNGTELGCLPPIAWMPIEKPNLPEFCEGCNRLKLKCDCYDHF